MDAGLQDGVQRLQGAQHRFALQHEVPAAPAELLPEPGKADAAQQQSPDLIGRGFLTQQFRIAGDLDEFAKSTDGSLIDLCQFAIGRLDRE